MGRPTAASVDRRLLGKTKSLLLEALERRSGGPDALAAFVESFDVEDSLSRRAFDLIVAETSVRCPRTSRKRRRSVSLDAEFDLSDASTPVDNADAGLHVASSSRRRINPVTVGGPSSWAALAAPTDLVDLASAHLVDVLSVRDEADIDALRDGWPLANRRRVRARPGHVWQRHAPDGRSGATTSGVPYVAIDQMLLETDVESDEDAVPIIRSPDPAPPPRRRRYYPSAVAASGVAYHHGEDEHDEDILPTGMLDAARDRSEDRFARDRATELGQPPHVYPDDVALGEQFRRELDQTDQSRQQLSLRDFLDTS